MNYSLGNMLSGGKVLGPALNLQFATDQSLTARKGATPTFTRASTGTFVGSNGLIQSASINTARFESDGLLIEPQRTNIVPTDNPSAAAWSALTNVTKVSNAQIDPTGATGGVIITETTANGLHAIGLPTSLYASVAVDYVISFYAKSLATRNPYTATEFNTLRNATLNASTNAVVGGTGATNATSVAAPSGFRRVSYSSQSIHGAVTSCRTSLGMTNVTSVTTTFLYPSYVGVVTESASFWGMQIELGTYPSSIIPTTGAAATRSADVCTLTIPNNVSSILITYGDNTTSTVSVTPGGTYVLPTSVKKYKSIISL
jgi:hypothetical protein